MNAAQIIHQALTAKFGPHQGLNADWSVCAWPIGNGQWLVDNEDGTYAVCTQTVDEEGNLVTSEV